MTKTTQLKLSGLAALIAVLVWALPYIGIDQDVYDIKSGKYKLVCNIGGSVKVIEPIKITDKKGPYWVFTNGQAQNCWKE